MFQRRSQPAYSGVESTSEQHILTVLRFHEVRLGKIEKHLVTINKQLELLTMQRKQEPKKQEPTKVSTQTKSTNNIAEHDSLMRFEKHADKFNRTSGGIPKFYERS